jgi:altronate dehydratase large subunit
MSSVSCANGVVNDIGRELPEVKTITHTEGCGRGPDDFILSHRTLSGLCKNPNVFAVVVVGLGCEFITASSIRDGASSSQKPIEYMNIQDEGGSQKTTRKGIHIAADLLKQSSLAEREECEWDKLCVGLECGGSDAMSGVTANPLVGKTADWLVKLGATVILSETTEMMGTADILSKRAATLELKEKIRRLISYQEQLMDVHLGPFKNIAISPGNMDGGLSTIREKSMGCIIKGGTSPINELIEYAAEPTQKGLVLMNTPGSDIFSLTGMASGGAQIMIFTTGRGTPVGFPIVPVIKIATNNDLYQKMNDDMDFNAGKILEGRSIEEMNDDLNKLVKKVVEGEETKAERNLQDTVSIQTVGPAF